MDLAALYDPGKHPLPGHDTVAGLLPDHTVVVAFLADLGHFQHRVSDGKPAGDGQAAEIEALHHQIFAERAVLHPDFLAELFDLFCTEQADLPVPVPTVGVVFHTPFHRQPRRGYRRFDRAPLRTRADGQKLSHRYPPIRYIPRVAGIPVSPK